MNNTLYVSEDTTFDEEIFNQMNVETRNVYATEPIPAIKKHAYQLPDEEELHTSFEEAISDRLFALHSRLSRLSNFTYAVPSAERNTDAVLSTTAASVRNVMDAKKLMQRIASPASLANVSHPTSGWKRITMFACSATMLLLFGFDLMGLLILHMH